MRPPASRETPADRIGQFYRDHWKDVLAYACYLAPNPDAAYDAAQETFCRALETLEDKNLAIVNPRAWLIGILRHALAESNRRQRIESDSWRRHMENRRLPQPLEPAVLDSVLAARITDFIERECSALERRVFLLRHYEQMSLSAIAAATHQSVTSVHRILAALTQWVRERFSPS